jgi:hypothetical protein
VTLEELKALKVGEKVRIEGRSFPPLAGAVWAIDEACVEIHWHNLTSSLIWFANVASGMDHTAEWISRGKPGRRKS